jgi:hypothetical protein
VRVPDCVEGPSTQSLAIQGDADRGHAAESNGDARAELLAAFRANKARLRKAESRFVGRAVLNLKLEPRVEDAGA